MPVRYSRTTARAAAALIDRVTVPLLIERTVLFLIKRQVITAAGIITAAVIIFLIATISPVGINRIRRRNREIETDMAYNNFLSFVTGHPSFLFYLKVLTKL